jgi:hypothetical protein
VSRQARIVEVTTQDYRGEEIVCSLSIFNGFPDTAGSATWHDYDVGKDEALLLASREYTQQCKAKGAYVTVSVFFYWINIPQWVRTEMVDQFIKDCWPKTTDRLVEATGDVEKVIMRRYPEGVGRLRPRGGEE